MKTICLLAILALPALAQDATLPTVQPGPDISAYYRLPGMLPDLVKYPSTGGYPYRWLRLPPNSIFVQADGTPYFVLPPPVTGAGLIPEPIQGSPNAYRVGIDKTVVFYRAQGPQDPVPVIGAVCSGDAGIAVDRLFLYICAPPLVPGSGVGNWTWAGAPLQTSLMPAPAMTNGRGILIVSTAGAPPQIAVDTAYIPFIVPAPTGPGPCTDPVSGLPYGSAAEARDLTGHYYCVANADNSGFIWMKTPGVVVW